MATMTMTDFTQGRRFRVVKDGAALTGMVAAGVGMWRPLRMELPVGSIITCLGRAMSWGSDGVPVIVWGDQDGVAFAPDAEFSPRVGDLWVSVPDPDFLNVLEE